MLLENLNIGTRLGLGFLLVLSFLALVAASGYQGMSQIQGQFERVLEINVKKMELLEDMSEAVHIVARVSRSIVLLSDTQEIKAEMNKIAAARISYDAASVALEKMPASEAGIELRRRIAALREETRGMNNQLIELARSNSDAEATDLILKRAGPATQKWQDVLSEYSALQRKTNAEDLAVARTAYNAALLYMLLFAAAAIVLGACVAWFTSGSITGPLQKAVAIAEAVAAGDLSRQIDAGGDDETGQLMRALKSMNDSLAGIVREVRAGTDSIATASGQIAAGNLDLSSRTEQQAGSLEETASSMEELTSTVRHNADNAKQANALARSASDIAERGGKSVAQVAVTMGAIKESSAKIGEILTLIDGIAFQTNILALNAAVEAARAGEQGRGFAVVASEVRTLAQRSAAAATDIKRLIETSSSNVVMGVKLVEDAAANTREIVDSVGRVTAIMQEITAATQEQAAGIEVVNEAITQMDHVTQQNAALVEEAAAASDSLQIQAAALAASVSVFTLDASAAPAARAPQLRAVPTMAAQAPAVRSMPKPASAVRKVAIGARRADDWEEF